MYTEQLFNSLYGTINNIPIRWKKSPKNCLTKCMENLTYFVLNEFTRLGFLSFKVYVQLVALKKGFSSA